MKSNINSENIYRYLNVLSSKEADKLLAGLGEYDPLPMGYVTDGRGKIYTTPNKGATPLYSIEGDDYFKYRYNWETQEIEAYAIIEPLPDVNNYSFIDSYGLSASNYIDNPEYWTLVFATTLEDIANSEVEVKEYIGPFGEYEFEDKEIYKYMIKAQVVVAPNNYTDETFEDVYVSCEESYSNYITTLSKKETLYTEPLEIACSFSPSTSTVYVNIDYTMPMTKDDLVEIWDEFEDEILHPEGIDCEVSLEDLDMIEV